jgi:hypothetical protein
MKARDIEDRLQETLPLVTDRFTNEVSISTVVPSGTVATATTTAVHKLTTGDSVIVVGVNAPVPITSITRVGTIATVVTTLNHDLTEEWYDTATLSGANEAEFNGDFTLVGTKVSNRKTFTLAVADSGPTTGTGAMQLDSPGAPFGFNGKVIVTSTPSTTSFTYNLPQALTVTGTGDNARVVIGARIHAAITQERADDLYDTEDSGDLTAFVVLSDTNASRDRNTRTDAVASGGVASDIRQPLIRGFDVLVFQKITESTSGANERDDMEDIGNDLRRVLCGWEPPTQLAVKSGNIVKFLSDGLRGYTTGIYSHMFSFELTEYMENSDLMIEPFNVAFRDIAAAMTNDQGEQPLVLNINLDDVPL